ncbi:HD domain-containing phosphohydrolase [Jeotgalibacillus haloalkalitolerans]|uniref:HD domain-containing protein n=1 Tax=Jeotgalibacillus haloalkalitolerans TaxID=3104292 RepID=A0ABU5KPZ5_9BACL|nr:HD domain-containing phosphohydrolase [Jeotgalibacillus sp. HH7-29]MDZ5713328.1 HD domain-containing protein [Jeotgalibacillus sp. HH7-29]
MKKHSGSSIDIPAEELLKIIFEFASKLAHENDLDQLHLLMAEMGRRLTLADRCTLWIADPSEKKLWTKIAHGIDRIEIPIDSGLVGAAYHSGESISINDAYKDSRFNPAVDQKTGYRTYSILCIPIRNADQEMIGVYQAVNKQTSPSHFTEKDTTYLSLAATYTGQSMEKAILYSELIESQKEMILTMGNIGESRSRETGQHVKRVAAYSYLIAKGSGLSEEESRLIELASPMHDIGKVAVPDAILNKPGKLTDIEFNQMKNHAEIGYGIFKKSKRKILQAAALIARDHHEKWDGSGYPAGRSGEGIHLYGRIVAIADVFDALGSKRPYKEAWPLEKILELIRLEKGKHFDPALVEAFFDNLDAIIKVKEQYTDEN